MSRSRTHQSRDFARGHMVFSIVFMCLVVSCATDRNDGRSQEDALAGMTITYVPEEQERLPLIERHLVDGRQRVEVFFGGPFRETFSVRIFSNRVALTEHWRREWNLPEFDSACWMVASGDVNLDLLSPVVWETEACEHDPSDETEVQRLIAHELVHVYHTQVHPNFDAEELVGIGWMVEGVATYVSGQVDSLRKARAREAIELGEVPQRLADAWSGPYRYAVSGTLVAYIDEVFGRDVVNHLMTMSTQDEILDALGISEAQLFESWAQHTLRGSD